MEKTTKYFSAFFIFFTISVITADKICRKFDVPLAIFTFLTLSIIYLVGLRFRFIKKIFDRIFRANTTIVVVIIGLLICLSKPYVKCYSSQSKMSEAKIQLASIYNSEIGSLNDNGTFSTCLKGIGYERSARGYYIIGFVSHDRESFEVLKAKKISCNDESFSVPEKLLSSDKNLLISVLKKQHQRFSKNTFTAYAVGDIGNFNNERALDIWSLNENKEFIHVQNGLEDSTFLGTMKKNFRSAFLQ